MSYFTIFNAISFTEYAVSRRELACKQADVYALVVNTHGANLLQRWIKSVQFNLKNTINAFVCLDLLIPVIKIFDSFTISSWNNLRFYCFNLS